MKPDVLQTLRQLVRIPSVNPMGRDVTGAEYFEHALTDYLQGFFESLAVPWYRQHVAPLRENIMARLDGSVPPGRGEKIGGEILVFEVHQDTVPADGMTIDPWEPTIKNGRLYGRGACDVKGAMACMLTAFARLAAERPEGRPTLLMACTVNEEAGFTGAQALADGWLDAETALLPRRPDAVIVAEPTSLDVVVAHKGVVRWRCHTHGRAAHSSRPDQGDNAIYHMGHALVALQEYAARLSLARSDAALGAPTLSVGTIQGGISVNTVADSCTIEVDRRLLPDEQPEAARQDVIDWLAGHVPDARRLHHDPPLLVSGGLHDQSGTRLAKCLQRVIRHEGHSGRFAAVPYGTDAPCYAAQGIPTVVFGPGSIEQAHTASEWIAIDQLHVATRVYYQLGRAGTTGPEQGSVTC